MFIGLVFICSAGYYKLMSRKTAKKGDIFMNLFFIWLFKIIFSFILKKNKTYDFYTGKKKKKKKHREKKRKKNDVLETNERKLKENNFLALTWLN